jgi:uncharacterized protein
MSGSGATASIPLAHPGPADAPYWRELAKGRLVMQCCQGCGDWKFPPVYRCGDCGAWDPEWREVALEGVVYSWTKSWHAFGGTEGIGALPYVTVLAALPQAGGRRLLGLLDGDEAKLALGAPLRGRIDTTLFGDKRLPSLRWRPL